MVETITPRAFTDDEVDAAMDAVKVAIRDALMGDAATPLWYREQGITLNVWCLGTPFVVTLCPLPYSGDGWYCQNETEGASQ